MNEPSKTDRCMARMLSMVLTGTDIGDIDPREVAESIGCGMRTAYNARKAIAERIEAGTVAELAGKYPAAMVKHASRRWATSQAATAAVETVPVDERPEVATVTLEPASGLALIAEPRHTLMEALRVGVPPAIAAAAAGLDYHALRDADATQKSQWRKARASGLVELMKHLHAVATGGAVRQHVHVPVKDEADMVVDVAVLEFVASAQVKDRTAAAKLWLEIQQHQHDTGVDADPMLHDSGAIDDPVAMLEDATVDMFAGAADVDMMAEAEKLR